MRLVFFCPQKIFYLENITKITMLNPNTRLPLPFMRNVECLFLFHTLIQLKHPEQRDMGWQVEIRNKFE